MARIAGIDLPNNKRIEIGLTYLFGIGLFSAKKMLAQVKIDPSKRVHELTDDDVALLRKIVEADYKVEGTLRGDVSQNIRRLIDIKSYRGLRHRRSLPVHGQRTKSNSRTRKGPRRKIGGKRK